MLANMFSGELVPGIQDEQGAYMLDRTPKYFEPILHYLRTKELVIDPNVSMDGVLGEARYFGIQILVVQIEKLKLAEEQKKSDERLLFEVRRIRDVLIEKIYRNIRN